MRMEESICTFRAAVFVTFMATRHLSTQCGSRSRTLLSLATARSARRDDTTYALWSAYSANTTFSYQSCNDLREWGCHQ
ncbi:hypothetical protein EVAR_16469_1 [Eumeta japonica]|uniref:Uncharacterized protein n=1 Tax=Eumeta variegata TaxID=151549 RepID=A0A4C1ULB7_EUMVA|nr:hypothetical protein EVAR_16469_1 [Eumeta japonica]